MPSTRLHFGETLVAPRPRGFTPSETGARALSRSTNVTLWIIQSVLALLFLVAGGTKLMVPAAALAAQSHLPGEFMKLIGIAETLGALGLVLPGILRVHIELTPLAAVGLVGVMTGATVITVIQGPAVGAIVPFVVGSLCTFVALRRREHGSAS